MLLLVRNCVPCYGRPLTVRDVKDELVFWHSLEYYRLRSSSRFNVLLQHLLYMTNYLLVIMTSLAFRRPIPVAERFMARVCGRSHAGSAGSNPARGMDVCVVSVVCCQVEVSATGGTLVQRTPTD